MKIHGLNKTTLLDYPGHVSCTVFCGNCNFRCPFCHNADLVLAPSSQPCIPEEEFFAFLNKRKNILEGVCITGGEPTLQSDLTDFIRRIKSQGFLVKLDTNGYRPEVLKSLIAENLLDYVAMDIKSSKEGYALACGLRQPDIAAIETSVALLMQGNIPYEFRTTVVKELHTKEDFLSIAEWLKGCDAYYLQPYTESDAVLHVVHPQSDMVSLPKVLSSYTPEELKTFLHILQEKGIPAHLRGISL